MAKNPKCTAQQTPLHTIKLIPIRQHPSQHVHGRKVIMQTSLVKEEVKNTILVAMPIKHNYQVSTLKNTVMRH